MYSVSLDHGKTYAHIDAEAWGQSSSDAVTANSSAIFAAGMDSLVMIDPRNLQAETIKLPNRYFSIDPNRFVALDDKIVFAELNKRKVFSYSWESQTLKEEPQILFQNEENFHAEDSLLVVTGPSGIRYSRDAGQNWVTLDGVLVSQPFLYAGKLYDLRFRRNEAFFSIVPDQVRVLDLSAQQPKFVDLGQPFPQIPSNQAPEFEIPSHIVVNEQKIMVSVSAGHWLSQDSGANWQWIEGKSWRGALKLKTHILQNDFLTFAKSNNSDSFNRKPDKILKVDSKLASWELTQAPHGLGQSLRWFGSIQGGYFMMDEQGEVVVARSSQKISSPDQGSSFVGMVTLGETYGLVDRRGSVYSRTQNDGAYTIFDKAVAAGASSLLEVQSCQSSQMSLTATRSIGDFQLFIWDEQGKTFQNRSSSILGKFLFCHNTSKTVFVASTSGLTLLGSGNTPWRSQSWSQTLGLTPSSLDLRKLRMASLNDGVDEQIFLGLEGQIHSSIDGLTWIKEKPLPFSSLKELYGSGGLLYALTDGAIYVSNNNAKSWVEKPLPK
jgi:hypothetical protein